MVLVRRRPLTKMVLMPEAGEICFLDIVGDLQVVKLSRSAILPVKEDSEYQIFSAHRLTVRPKSSAIVETCLTVRHVMGGGVYGKICKPAEFADDSHIEVIAHQTVDEDFLCPLFVVIRNKTSDPYEIKFGDKIAQIIMTDEEEEEEGEEEGVGTEAKPTPSEEADEDSESGDEDEDEEDGEICCADCTREDANRKAEREGCEEEDEGGLKK